MARTHFGYHAVLNITGDISHFNIEQLAQVMRNAALAGGSKILGENFHPFGEGMGNTGMLVLAESHISVHQWPEDNFAAFDIYMCTSKESVEAAILEIENAAPINAIDVEILERTKQ